MRIALRVIKFAGLFIAGLFIATTFIATSFIARTFTQTPFAQTASAQANRAPTFQTDVKLVRLLVNVKTPAGELVGSVDKSEFTVFDNGVAQEISVFERYTTKPLSVAMLVDTSGSTRKDWQVEVRSIRRFLNALFREGNERDAAALFTFDYDVTMRHDFTRDAQRLENSVRGIKPEGSTSLYDAIYLASQQLQRRGDGRRVIVLVGDGGNTTSAKGYKDAQEAAQRADVVMYPIVIVPIENDAGRNTGGEHALQTLATNTGGRWFDPTLGELDKTFVEILSDLRAQYMLAYYPKNLPADTPKFHSVRVEIQRKDLRAQTRAGYYGEDSR
jgi:Ca-activated chloride channel family protein